MDTCIDDQDRPDVSDPDTRPTDGCNWCLGYFDGYMVGETGLDPNGKRHDYDPDLLGNADYRDGVSVGRADRVERDQLATA